MRKIRQCLSGIFALLFLVASIPLNGFAATNLAITTQPTNQAVVEGANVSFTVAATGATSYQWQVDTGSGWKNLTNGTTWQGNTTNTLTFVSKSTYLNYKFRCSVSNGSSSIKSNAVTFSFKDPLKITKNPANQTVVAGGTVKFTVQATGATSYQWQVDTGSGWKNLTNATTWKGNKTATLSFTAKESYTSYRFRCSVSDGSTSIKSKAVTFTLNEPLAILEQPQSQVVCFGDEVRFFVEAKGADTYQWQVNTGSSWKNLSDNGTWAGVTTPELAFEAQDSYLAYSFRCVVKDSAGNKLISDIVSFEYLTYTVTYDAGEGLLMGSRFYTENIQPSLYNVGLYDGEGNEIIPEYQNHVFVGWKYNGRLARMVDVYSDVTLTAVWDDACKIKYNPNGGSFNDETIAFAQQCGMTVDGNSLIQTEAPGTYLVPQWIIPEREGYEFKGWKQGNAYVRNVSTNNPTSAVELYADWEQTVTITYDANGGYWQFSEDEEPFTTVSVKVKTGTNYLGWHEPQREGYIFYGWLDQNNVNKVKVYVEGNITVRAMWKKVHNVTYHANGGYFIPEGFHNDWTYPVGDYCQYNDKFYECISAIEEPGEWDESCWQEVDIVEDMVSTEREGTYIVRFAEPQREGYKFLGWSGLQTARRGERDFRITLLGDVDYYATWGKEGVEVTFDANGGYIPWGEGDEYQEFDYIILGSDPENGIDMIWADQRDNEAYRFLGWSEEEDATEAQYNPHQRIYPQDSMTLYAVFEKRPAIHFDGNGGVWSWEEHDDATNQDYEVVVEERTEYKDKGQYYYVRAWEPENEGYRFDGWLDAKGNPVDDRQPILLKAGDEYNYKAKWVKQIEITYDANGGDWGEDEQHHIITEKYWDGDGGDVHIGMDWPQKDGFSFVGWSADPDADFTTEDIEADFDIVLNTDATYYAIWCENFTVTFDGNGGVCYYDNETPVLVEEWHDICYGDFELKDWINRDGYEFLGWSTNPDATAAKYNARDRIIIKGETTFYAVWHKYPTVTYDANEGQWGKDEDIELIRTHWQNDGEYYYVGMEGPWRDGYEFAGWVDENGEKVEEGTQLILNTDYEFFAKWTRKINVRYYANGGQFFRWDEGTQQEYPEGKCLDREGKTGEELWLEGWQPHKDIESEFLGWALTEDAGPEDILDNPYIIPDDYDEDELDLYAVWLDYVRIEYNFTGGEFNGMDHVDWTLAPEEDFEVGFDWPYKEGYEFIGWSTDPDAEDAEPNYTYDLLQDTVFYAIWAEKVAVTFNAGEGVFNNGEQSIVQYFRYGDVVDWDRDFGTEGDVNIRPFRDGYWFNGWMYNGEKPNYVRVTDEMTLTADWIKVSTVTLDANGGYMPNEEGENVDSIVLTETVDCSILASEFEPIKNGYVFLGWYKGDTLVDKITFEEDGTFIARWENFNDVHGEENNPWGITSVEISVNYDVVTVGETFSFEHYAEGAGTTFVWYRSTDQSNWVPINEGDSWIEETLYTPGTYYYKLVIDDVESNIVTVTVEPEE